MSIMSPRLHQEESRSISENVTWGQRKRFADGKVSLPYGRFLGYEKGEDGLPKIIEKEAAVVRLIYKLFLEGKTPSGKSKWQPTSVVSILQNEKYKGHAILQKTFTTDFLTKKKKLNEGELPQYYVENSHPGIVTPEVYDLVQIEFKKRKNAKGYKTGGGCFSGKIVCGECGSFYGSKVWHSTSKYRRTIWQCNHKFKNDEKCSTPHFYEDILKSAFLEAINNLLENKAEILQDYEIVIEELIDTSKLEKESAKLLEERSVVTELLRKCVEENAYTAQDQDEYNKKYGDLKERFEKIEKKLHEISERSLERSAQSENIREFIRMLKERDDVITEFDEGLWNSTVEKVIVNSEHEITFVFKDGMELDWNI